MKVLKICRILSLFAIVLFLNSCFPTLERATLELLTLNNLLRNLISNSNSNQISNLSVAGTISGFSGGNLVLNLNGNLESISITANGNWAFNSVFELGNSYSVSIGNQSNLSSCIFEDPTKSIGTITSTPSDFQTIRITCVPGKIQYGQVFNPGSSSPDNFGSMDELPSITTIAGQVTAGFNDGNGLAAQFSRPSSVLQIGNNLYIADSQNHRIRSMSLVSPYTVSTLAGSGTSGFADGVGIAAQFSTPTGICTDSQNIYVVELNGRRLRKINIASQNVTLLAGDSLGSSGSVDGVGTLARFFNPTSCIVLGTAIYITDQLNHSIRKFESKTNLLSTFAGQNGSSGNTDGIGNVARFNLPGSITSDGSFLYVAEIGGDNLVRRIEVATANVTTIAGSSNFVTQDLRDSSNGSNAKIGKTSGITTDGKHLYLMSVSPLANFNSARIIRISLSAGNKVETYWNNGTNNFGNSDGSTYALAAICPDADNCGASLMVDLANQRIILSDTFNNTIRMIETNLLAKYAQDSSLNDSVSLSKPLSTFSGILARGSDQKASPNTSLVFDGSTKLQADSTGFPTGNSDLTICAWIYTSVLPSVGQGFTAISYGDGTATAGSTLGLGIYNNGGTSYFSYSRNDADNIFSNNFPVAPNTWFHYCVAYGSSGTIYTPMINGRVGTQTTTPANWNNSLGKINIGGWINNLYNWTGRIADVRVYKIALSPEMAARLAIQIPDGIAGAYPMNQTAAALNAIDSSIYKNRVTRFGNPATAMDRYGFPTSARSLTPTNYFRQTTNLSRQTPGGSEPHTACFWFRKTLILGIQSIVSFGDFSSNDTTNAFNFSTDNTQIFNGGTGTFQDTSGFRYPNNTWNHVCQLYDGSSTKVYVNGQFLGRNYSIPYSIENSLASSYFCIGARPNVVGTSNCNTNAASGDIDELLIYNRVLSQAEIRALSGPHPYQVSNLSYSPSFASDLSLFLQADHWTTLPLTGNPWWDHSGSSNDVIANNTMVYNGTGLNGRPTINGFTGTNFFEKGSAATNIGGDAFSFFAIATKPATIISNNNILSMGPGANGSDIFLYTGGIFGFSKSGVGDIQTIPSYHDGFTQLLYGIVSNGTAGSNVTFKRNGSVFGNTNVTQTAIDRTTNLRIGKSIQWTDFYEGGIGELIWFRRVLSTAEQNIVECYLSSKYRYPLDSSVVCP